MCTFNEYRYCITTKSIAGPLFPVVIDVSQPHKIKCKKECKIRSNIPLTLDTNHMTLREKALYISKQQYTYTAGGKYCIQEVNNKTLKLSTEVTSSCLLIY